MTVPRSKKQTLRVAHYARYSPGPNQGDRSISGQQELARENLPRAHGFQITPGLYYADRASSGRSFERADLDRLVEDAETGLVDVVVVEKISRLGRNHLGCACMLEDFRSMGVRIIGLVDNVDSSNERDWMKAAVLGIVSEATSREIADHTKRGQFFSRQEGYHCGDLPYGFRSIASTATRTSRSGEVRPAGYIPEPDPRTIPVYLRMVERFFQCHSLNRIARDLNDDGVESPSGPDGTWTPKTIRNLLENPKFAGEWAWGTSRVVRHGRTGKAKPEPRPRHEWDVQIFEQCKVISKARFNEIQEELERRGDVFAEKGRPGFKKGHAGYSSKFPKTLLSGAMVCALCGGSMCLMTRRHGGYFGCLRARNHACDNRVKVRRDLAERLLIRAVRDTLSADGLADRIHRRVKAELKRLRKVQPGALDLRRRELQEEKRQQRHFVAALARGNTTEVLDRAMAQSEARIHKLEKTIAALTQRFGALDDAPSKASIEQQFLDFQDLLETRTTQSALALREILGPVRVSPVTPPAGRPYLHAECRLGVLDLLSTDLRGVEKVNDPARSKRAAPPSRGERRASAASRLIRNLRAR